MPPRCWMPDWQGKNRLDSLRNIVRDGRFSLMFLVPGKTDVVRINGTAQVTADDAFGSPGWRTQGDAAGNRRRLHRGPRSISSAARPCCARTSWNRNDAADLPRRRALVADAVPRLRREALDAVYDQSHEIDHVVREMTMSHQHRGADRALMAKPTPGR